MSNTIRTIEDRAGRAEAERQAALAQAAHRTLLIGQVLRYGAIALVALVFVFPFLWMILASFKSQTEIMNPSNVLVFTPTLQNYTNVFNQYSFSRFMINSFIVALVSTFFSLVLGLPAAYAIARFQLRGLGLVLLAARIVPGITFLIPWFILFTQVHLVGSKS